MQFDLAKWVYNARTHANLTQEELALRLGFSGKASVSSYEKGRSIPSFETVWGIGRECSYPLPQNEFNQSFSQVKNSGTQIENSGTQKGTANNTPQIVSNGNQKETRNTISQTTTINNNSSESSEIDETETAPDNCMYPIIPQGARLWVDKKNKKDIYEGKVYLIKLGGWKTIRRLSRLPNQEVRVSAQNTDYPDETIPLVDLDIIGRITSWRIID